MGTHQFMTAMKITVLVGLGWGCSDHGIKIHEDPPTASLLSPGENTPFFEGQSVGLGVQRESDGLTLKEGCVLAR